MEEGDRFTVPLYTIITFPNALLFFLIALYSLYLSFFGTNNLSSVSIVDK